MEWKGSFIGFTFGNRHSSKLGIFRTSSSDRYESNLSSFSDVVTDVPGSDGKYYWGSKHQHKEIPISFAFYGMTEEQLSQIKQVFNDKKIHDLIFDEEPYKVWSAKLTGTAVCKHVCFERDNQRFYCGEGTFTFTAYYPYARSRYEYIEGYTLETVYEWIDNNSLLVSEFEEGIIYPAILSYGEDLEGDSSLIVGLEESFSSWLEETNLLVDSSYNLEGVNSCIDLFLGNGAYYNLEEWREASQIPSSEEYGGYSNGAYHLYNAGDIEMPFKLYLEIGSAPQTFNVLCGDSNFLLNGVVAKRDKTTQVYDTYIMIDTRSGIVRGCDNNKKPTKNLYNEYLTSGNFFQLPPGTCDLYAPEGFLEFNYLYL